MKFETIYNKALFESLKQNEEVIDAIKINLISLMANDQYKISKEQIKQFILDKFGLELNNSQLDDLLGNITAIDNVSGEEVELYNQDNADDEFSDEEIEDALKTDGNTAEVSDDAQSQALENI